MNNNYMLESFVDAVDTVVRQDMSMAYWRPGMVVVENGWEIGINAGRSAPFYPVVFHARDITIP